MCQSCGIKAKQIKNKAGVKYCPSCGYCDVEDIYFYIDEQMEFDFEKGG